MLRALAFRRKSAPNGLTIALVCDGIADVVAGSFISTARLGERLQARGHRVVFISSGSREQTLQHVHRGMTIHRLWGVVLPRSGHLRLAVPFGFMLRRLLRDEQIDIVHVMLPTPLGAVAGRLAKAMGLPLVMHSHTQPDNIFMNGPHFPGRDALTRLFGRYLTWLYRQGDVLVHPSAFSQRQFPVPGASRHEVISNGVDRRWFRPTAADAFRQRFQLSRGTQHLLYVGRLHPEKNVETLIRAMPMILARRPHTHLLLVGLGYKQPTLQRVAEACAVAAQVTFCGFVPDVDLPAAYNACDLFVLPSLAELEGIAVLEAMACGKPILIADATDSAATDLVEGNGLLFHARDPEHLAAQACRLLSDAPRLRAMGTKSLVNSRAFDINESVAALEAVYYSLLSTPVTGRPRIREYHVDVESSAHCVPA